MSIVNDHGFWNLHENCLFDSPPRLSIGYLQNSINFGNSFPTYTPIVCSVSFQLSVSIHKILSQSYNESLVINQAYCSEPYQLGWGVSTLRRAVSGEKQNNSSRNLKILPGIERYGKFSGRQEVYNVKISRILRYFANVSQKFRTIFQIFGRTFSYTCSAQTAFVRDVPHLKVGRISAP